jgi:hypothetical protein
MPKKIRVYVLLAGILFGVCGLERVASTQGEYEVNLWALCDLYQWDGNVQGWCYGYDDSWGCAHWNYVNEGWLQSSSRGEGFGGGGWEGGTLLPWNGETGPYSVSATFTLNCDCIWGNPVTIGVEETRDFSPTLTLDPSDTYEVFQNSEGVTVAATVSNPEFNSLVSWSGEGIDVGDPLSRAVSTSEIGDFVVTATLGTQSRSTTVRVTSSCPEIPNATFLGASTGSYPYSVNPNLMSSEEILGISEGFSNWTSKNVQSGLNATYCKVGDNGCGVDASITVAEGDAGSNGGLPNYAKMDITTIGGRARSGVMTISNIASNISGRDAYKKIVQHELGHFHGMDHAGNAPVGSTVMRTPIGRNGRYLPNAPTQCDADKALERGQ